MALEPPLHQAMEVRIEQLVLRGVPGAVDGEMAERSGGPIASGERIALIDPQHRKGRIDQSVLEWKRIGCVGWGRGRWEIAEQPRHAPNPRKAPDPPAAPCGLRLPQVEPGGVDRRGDPVRERIHQDRAVSDDGAALVVVGYSAVLVDSLAH